jgi:hypothetical protein
MNTSSLLIIMFCAFVVVVGTLIVLTVILLKPKSKKSLTTNVYAVKCTNPKKWIALLIIAFALAFWSTWIALLFVAIAWLLNLNPSPDSNYTLDKNQKATAKRVYAWLFWSSFITVPFLIMLLNTTSSNYFLINNRDFTVLVPLVFHIPLLAGLTSKNAFVYRHTQQGILLIAIRAGMAALTITHGQLGLFVLGNGALWLFGTIWGNNQIFRNESWWMKRKGETIILPEVIQPDKPNEVIVDKSLNGILKSVDTDSTNTPRQKALQTFRTGTPEEKKQAVLALSQLGEVEKF